MQLPLAKIDKIDESISIEIAFAPCRGRLLEVVANRGEVVEVDVFIPVDIAGDGPDGAAIHCGAQEQKAFFGTRVVSGLAATPGAFASVPRGKSCTRGSSLRRRAADAR